MRNSADTGAREPQADRYAQTIRGALWHGQGLGGHNNYRAAEEALAALLALAAGVGEARPAEPPTMYEVIWEWLAENNPRALELCPYKMKRSVSAAARRGDESDRG